MVLASLFDEGFGGDRLDGQHDATGVATRAGSEVVVREVQRGQLLDLLQIRGSFVLRDREDRLGDVGCVHG
jgi:hypothetical protein